MTRRQQLARRIFGAFRYIFATAPWMLVLSYSATCLWGTWVLGRKPQYGELDGTLMLGIMRLITYSLFFFAPSAVLVYPLVRRRGISLLDLVVISGMLTVVVVLAYDIGGYLEWYRD